MSKQNKIKKNKEIIYNMDNKQALLSLLDNNCIESEHGDRYYYKGVTIYKNGVVTKELRDCKYRLLIPLNKSLDTKK